MNLIYFLIVSIVLYHCEFIQSDNTSTILENYESGIKSNNRLYGILQRGKDLLRLIPKLGIKISGQILKYIPSPREVFNFSKQILIGLPQEIIAYTLHIICSSALNSNALQPTYTPNIKEMNFKLITPDNINITVPLLKPRILWNHPKFRIDLKVVILVTGWNSNINYTNAALETLYEAYRCRDDYNFIVIDTSNFIDSLYTWSAFNTKTIGKLIGQAIYGLSKFVPIENIHLIGHSLGAHICGEAGRTFTQFSKKLLMRITGLDPARPCFNEGQQLSGLQRGDAEFVDIIHSNPGILGINEPIGDVDFFPNGQSPLQPGCWSIICAHSRSYEFFAETVYPGQEFNFMAYRCTSIKALKKGLCTDHKIPMGIATPSTTRGNYYLITNKKSPFGRIFDSKNKQFLIQKLRGKICKIKSKIRKICDKNEVLHL